MALLLLNTHRFDLWNPSTIASCQAWWDFADESKITVSSGRVSQANATVGGSNFTRIKSTGGPTKSTLNGKSCLAFGVGDGSTGVPPEYMMSTGTPGAETPALRFDADEFTMSVVVQTNEGSRAEAIWNRGSGTGRYKLGLNFPGSNDIRAFLLGGGITCDLRETANTHVSDGNAKVLTIIRNNTTGFAECWINGVQSATLALGGLGDIDEPGTAFSTLTLGGNRTSTSNYPESWSGKIGEIIFFGDRLENDDLLNLHYYLIKKWNAA